MDILDPDLIWIENRCYRVCDKSQIPDANELPSYVEETYESDCDAMNEEFSNESIEIVPDKGNRYKHSFHVNSHFYGFIIGSKGGTLKRLAAETNTQIFIPRMHQDGDVVIIGYNKKDIIAARYRIDLLIETSRSKLQFTHFIGIPVNSEEIKENFKKFKDDILKTCPKGAREITEDIFQIPEKLHLTIVMLVLLDEEDRKKVIDALKACQKNIITPFLKKNGPISIGFKGVDCMNDDPSETRVLYIQPDDETGSLQHIADKIANYFVDQGLARINNERTNGVKLHVTAMNQKRSDNINSFDATDILKNHKNTYFGKMNVTTIHLSQRHTTSKDGFYEATAKIDLIDS